MQKSCESSKLSRFLCDKEVAELLGVSQSYLKKYRTQKHNRGKAPDHMVINNRIRYDRDEIIRWLVAKK
jgi:predicted DNA-binding transcriptional regulator AlpA